MYSGFANFLLWGEFKVVFINNFLGSFFGKKSEPQNVFESQYIPIYK